MEKFFKDIAYLAQRALFYEVLLTPKPGLVDRANAGAHSDMDIYTFADSILVLDEYFEACVAAGYFYVDKDFTEIFYLIRPLGIEAEKRMFFATDGVNTHKGAIFIFGILCSAIGSLKRDEVKLDFKSICHRGGEISNKILEDFNQDFSKKEKLTYGEYQFLNYGSYGIRGEAKEGFPSIRRGEHILREALDQGLSFEASIGQVLLNFMVKVFDSNVVGRKGLGGLEFMKQLAKEALDLGGYENSEGVAKIKEMDKIFIEENISPGGCADLSAATIFVYWIEKYYRNL